MRITGETHCMVITRMYVERFITRNGVEVAQCSENDRKMDLIYVDFIFYVPACLTLHCRSLVGR